MDGNMPVMDGFKATKIIKHEMKNPIPIIGLTAFASQSYKEKCYSSGMVKRLVKPLNINKLKKILKKLDLL